MNFEIIKITREIKESLKPISLHDTILSKCSIILAYYPMKESKLEIYNNLDKRQRVGMLTRYILGVASKIGVYQSIIKEIVELKQNYKRYKYHLKNYKDDNKFWEEQLYKNQIEMNKYLNLLLDSIIEEISRRNDPKYLRKKKLNEIEQKNLQN